MIFPFFNMIICHLTHFNLCFKMISVLVRSIFLSINMQTGCLFTIPFKVFFTSELFY